MLANLFNRVLPSSDLRVYDKKAQCLSVESSSLEKVVNSQWLILAVPIPALKSVLQQIANIILMQILKSMILSSLDSPI